MTTVHSFDVFDTCLVRTFARPEDLFTELARQLLGASATPEEFAGFAHQRKQAESVARRATTHEDITLAKIYHHFRSTLSSWGLSTRAALIAEVNLEISCVRPIRAVQQRLAQLRRQGQRIIFISDMYLPASIIRLMLVNHNLALSNEPLYVSGDIGLTKYSGSLFDYVIQQEQIRPQELWHTGDNPRGDVIVPCRKGIKITYFRQSQLNRYEQLMLSQASDSPLQLSQWVGVSRTVRLQHADGSETDELVNIVANVVAPLLVSFVVWVLQDAHKNGFERLYFVSRDGQILHKIAQILAEHIPAPECRYLYGSRQAWFLPAVQRVDRDSLNWLMLHSKSPRHLLGKLNLTPEEISETLIQHNLTDWNDQLNAKQREDFWRVIETPEVIRLILKHAEEARLLTISYFAQESLLDSAKWALVDVGWAARGQRAVRQIVQTIEPNYEVHGYYLALSENRQSMANSGPYRVFFPLQDVSKFDSACRNVLNHTIVMEHLFVMADHGSVISYRQQGQNIIPILHDWHPSVTERKFVSLFQQVVLDYVETFVQTGLLGQCNCSMELLSPVLVEFFANPEFSTAKLAARVSANIDQTHKQHSVLARPLTLVDVLDVIVYFVRKHILHWSADYSPHYHWLASSLVLSVWFIRILFLPVNLMFRFKQRNGQFRFYDRISRFLAKEVL